MAILKVARMGHPVLRKKARAVDRREIKSATIQQLINDMLATMTEYHGAGLAAPQVHLDLRLFVAISSDDEHGPRQPIVLINPEIMAIGSNVAEDWEGCLSIPNVRGLVSRPTEVGVRAFDRDAQRVEFVARDFPARVMQHEYDHLDGILFLDRMRSLESLGFLTPVGDGAPAF